MPRRVWAWNQSEPARAIIFWVAAFTAIMQFVVAVLWWPNGIINFAIVLPVCIWCMYGCIKNNVKRMAESSFWLFMMWLWSGASQFTFNEVARDSLLWAPFIVVSIAVGICYVYFSAERRRHVGIHNNSSIVS